MRSIFVRILLWVGVLFIVSMASFVAISSYLFRRDGPGSPGGFMSRVTEMQVEDARQAWEQGGPAALKPLLERYDRYFRGQHRLLDAAGRDVLTGELHSRSAPQPEGWRLPPPFHLLRGPRPHVQLARRSRDERYMLHITGGGPRFEPPNYLPYYLPIVGIFLLGVYILAHYLGRPLRRLRETVLRFGQGDLEARTGSRRGDEFGDVSRTFDEMAVRIQTLLTAERRLLQDISHELRSPLARLSVAVELARTTQNSEVAYERIKRESNRIATLVGELIQMTRAEGDPAERKTGTVDLKLVLEEMLDDVWIEADARRIRLCRQLAADVLVEGDAEQLRRCAENVVRNAIRYSPEDACVEIRLERELKTAAITVRDRGPGVPDEMLEAIFRPFFRVEDDRARQSGGVGLGLAIAQRAAHLHHGEIHARNADPGLEVIIRLPM